MPEKTVPGPDQTPQAPGQEATREHERYVRPPVDIFETAEGLTVLADLPGVSRDALDIQVKDNLLTIQGQAKHTTPGSPIYREFELYSYYRQFELSDTVDVVKISAELKNGVLSLQLPRAEQTRPKQIKVQVA